MSRRDPIEEAWEKADRYMRYAMWAMVVSGIAQLVGIIARIHAAHSGGH